jgi:hypothetical protein
VVSLPATSAPAGPRRTRFARTLARARWLEYRVLLNQAARLGYRIVSLEQFVIDPPAEESPTLVLRHDVDQHPRSALQMAAIETAAQLTSTWYFRWRTADPRVIGRLRAAGFEVGLHYETLTRRLLRLGRQPIDEALLSSCRAELRAEIERFSERFGAIRSICPHGDTRVPGVHNGLLVRDRDPGELGGVIDSNGAMRGRRLAAWITDRSAPDGSWGHDANPAALLEERKSPLLLLTHPNNWAAGSSLLLDRGVSAAMRNWASRVPIRTRDDEPPL